MDDHKNVIVIKDTFIGKYWKTIVAGIAGIFILSGAVNVNMDYERSIITRLGHVQGVNGSGFHFKFPFIDDVHRVNLTYNVLEQKMEVATRGGENIILVTVNVNHKVIDETKNIERPFKEFGSRFDYENKILIPVLNDRAKSIISQYPVEDVITKRSEIRDLIAVKITQEMKKYGVNIIDFQMKDIAFSDAYAERLKSVAEARARAAKEQQDARRAEYEAQKKVAEAEGAKKVKMLQTDSQYYQQI